MNTMKRLIRTYLAGLWLVAGMGFAAATQAQNEAIDVLNYDLTVDMRQAQARLLKGTAVVDLRMLRADSVVDLSLEQMVLDSVLVDGRRTLDYLHVAPSLQIGVGPRAAGDTVRLVVSYRTSGYVEPGNWGGLHFENNLCYNLGVGFKTYPHALGRAWFPCNDSFTDKATYTLRSITAAGWTAQCSGLLTSQQPLADGGEVRTWRVAHPAPTYLISISAAPYRYVTRTVPGLDGSYPLTLGFVSGDSSDVAAAFDLLDTVVPHFERCFGPYGWERIGYVATPRGSMEHINNICLADQFMTGREEAGQATICHELGHAWFGNTLTCDTDGEMWFNEGGATFCSEVAFEAAYGASQADAYHLKKRVDVLQTTHLLDKGYRSVANMPTTLTYGSTVYDKGGMVWHSLRGYLGDSVFYDAMRRLFARLAYGNVNSRVLCDSLSYYSGVDLTDFFDFHVFDSGFVAYRVDSLVGSRVWLRQQTVGSTSLVNGNRVPVSFFSSDLQSVERTLTFDGRQASMEVSLPFEPAFAVVDLRHSLSTASIADTLRLDALGLRQSELLRFDAVVNRVAEAPAMLAVTHYWTSPDSAAQPGVTRMARRYWKVDGQIPAGCELSGYFHFVRAGSGEGADASLDRGFYEQRATQDSLVLLYRRDASRPWRMTEARRVGTTMGYFSVERLRTGEYALAVGDKARLAIDEASPAECELSLSPNPSDGRLTVTVRSGLRHLSAEVHDLQGVCISRRDNIEGDAQWELLLRAGQYVLTLRDARGLVLRSEKIVVR